MSHNRPVMPSFLLNLFNIPSTASEQGSDWLTRVCFCGKLPGCLPHCGTHRPPPPHQQNGPRCPGSSHPVEGLQRQYPDGQGPYTHTHTHTHTMSKSITVLQSINIYEFNVANQFCYRSSVNLLELFSTTFL